MPSPAQPGGSFPHWRYRVRQLAWAGIDLVFPPACSGCQKPGSRLCPDCQAGLLRLPDPICALCGYPLGGPQGGSRACTLCRSGAHAVAPLAGLRSAAFFDGPLRHAIHGLKYNRDIILADTLGRHLLAAWRAYQLPPGWVMPVPLSPQRLRERGYNQAGLLARALAELGGLRLLPSGAVRVRNTRSQVGLPPAERRANVAGAFSADPAQVAGRSLILVDDVCTTGATLAACAQALMVAGAAEVWGLTLARARFAQGRFAEPRPLAGGAFRRRRRGRAP